MPAVDTLPRLFLQLVVILGACRLLGALGRRLGQTQAVGEMVAGIVLGPSVLGALAPVFQTWLFPQLLRVAAGTSAVSVPHPSMAILFALSQLGLVLYMFLVGLDLQLDQLAGRMRSVSMVSVAGIAVPFVLGAGVALLFIGEPLFFPAGIRPLHAVLFTGAAMSITAFPMLARIIQEQGMAGTRVGTLALAAGSVNDIVAWCLLAMLLASLNARPAIALLAIAGGALFALFMFVVVRPALRVLSRWTERDHDVSATTLLSVLLVVVAAAAVTDGLGLHAVGGACVAGLVMPRGRLAVDVRRQMENLTTTLLLPLFFVYSGLNTSILLVNTPWLWMVTALIVGCAVAGKAGACSLAARAAGEAWREALAIGSLMNARGLMELIILNIGLQAGVITPTLFTIMVLMAVLTTLMASPLFRLVSGRHQAT